MYFNSIFSQRFSSSQITEDHFKVKESVRNLLEDLGLIEYYPQKLSYANVIKLTDDVFKDVNERPSTLQELPWYFMRRLIELNSSIREKGSIIRRTSRIESRIGNGKNMEKCEEEAINSDEDIFSTWSDDSEEVDSKDEDPEESESDENKMADNITCSVHPLDFIYIIFLCADDFLRQELADKMSKCQYAVPFILPSPEEKGDESMNTVLHWGLQTISRTYCEEMSQVMTKTLLNATCPLVSCLSLHTNNTWKCRLLNKMLSPHQDTFWHEGLEGGERIQKVSQGMVEVSWYLPAGKGSDEFKTLLTFTNMRGDADKYPVVAENLVKLSTTSCVFTDKINSEVVTFLGKYFGKKYIKRMILVVLHNPAEKTRHIRDVKKLKKMLKLDEYQVIHCSLEDSNFHTTYDILQKCIQTSIGENGTSQMSLSTFTEEVKSDNCMKVDDIACSEGYKAAKNILLDIENIEKSIILPCQSDVATREQMSKHDKEICRHKEIAESVLMTQHVKREEEEKWQLQWKQLQYPISNTFTHFLRCITNFNSQNRKYFLQSLKLGLNERSIDLLQPLYDEYEKYRLQDKTEKTNKKLRELNQQLMYSSVGLEHFFRELAVMYENMFALSKKLGQKNDHLVSVLNTLSKTMADILLEGETIEILDGDVVHCPVVWLQSVLNQIENKQRLRIFKVSALGAQSSGKSTLLNTTFRLNCPVSSGRCTRGAYMQLLKIDNKLSKQLRCDYLLVIDSEGLMSRVSKNDDYDNELATFVVGLSDLILVVFKGEGNEMQDVLPIAIHVFLRMNVLGELQACHFVHQNMGAVDVQKTMPVEIDTFVQLLDEKTRAAAQEAFHRKYKRFADVLHYNKNEDNTYVCGLWDGTPPMGKTNKEYSRTMHRLKGKIFERLETVVRKKHCSTLEDFSKWLKSIWEAVKYENFVFSFRNVLAVEAYKSLSRILNDKEWEIKKMMRVSMDKKKKEIKDKLTTQKDNSKMMDTIENMTKETLEKIKGRIQNLLSCIRHYFHCPGCQECSEEVRNRQFLRDYKGEFEHDIWRFMQSLEEEMNQTAKNITVELSSHKDSAMMDEILKQKVEHAIGNTKSQSCLETDKDTIFDEMWKTETEEILSKMHQRMTSDNFIKTTVEKTIRESLGPEYFIYNKKKADNSHKFHDQGFIIKKCHVNGGTRVIPNTLRQLKKVTELILKNTSAHYIKVEKGREFEAKHAETLFKDILNRIDQGKVTRSDYLLDSTPNYTFLRTLARLTRVDTTLDYKVDVMMHIEELAVRNFIWNQKVYEENRCPVILLERKRDAYHEIFLIATGKEDPAVGFSRIILKLIQENLEDRMTCTELLSILRKEQGNVFKRAEVLEHHSLCTRWSQSGRMTYRLSIAKYKEMIKETITQKSIACFEDGDCLKIYAQSTLGTIISELNDTIQKTVRGKCKSKHFIGTMFSNMNGLKKPHNDIEAYKMLQVEDKKQFTCTLIAQLKGPIRQQLKKEIASWNIAKAIEKKGLTEFVFNEVIGCLFCKVQQEGVFKVLDRDRTYSYLRSVTVDDFFHQDGQKGLQLKIHNCNESEGTGTEDVFITIKQIIIASREFCTLDTFQCLPQQLGNADRVKYDNYPLLSISRESRETFIHNNYDDEPVGTNLDLSISTQATEANSVALDQN